ncbi:MAG: hypothetical protein IPP71_17315 [Bacteroidetes bacterium]|nr:hypothetical protein [Bacteroidota bacterium]
MNVRTLNKEHSIHMIILGCMLMSWGVTCYYFDTIVPNEVISEIGTFLLYPIKMADSILSLFSNNSVSGHPTGMFFVLWICYTILALKLHPIFIVKNHQVTDLKKWYENKFSFSKQG